MARVDHVAETLLDHWKTACRNIRFHQRDLIHLIEKEKQAHEAVERAKHGLNEAVESRQQHENAMRALGIPIPEQPDA